jgi:dipeptidyl aminopeptidase/acylaminoacyl peptidase
MPTVAPSCCLFALLSCAGLVAQDRLTPELLWELGRVGDPQIAPDGSRLLYHVRRFRLAENRGTTHVFVLDLQDGGVRQLTTQGSNSNARWSPDGKRVAFVSTRSGSPQIWTIAVDGGEAEPVTDHPGGVANLAWAPDGRHFSFTAEVAVEPEPGAVFPDLPKAQALVYDDLMVRHWDAWEDGKRSHLFVVPVGGGPARDLMAGHRVDTPLRPFGGGEQIAWSPDGRELCYVAKHASDPENSTDSDLFVVSVDGGPHENITRGMPGYETNPNYSPDGRTIAFASMARAGYEADRNRLMAYSRADGTIRELAPAFDLSVAEFAWAPDASGLFLTADVRGAHHVFSVSAQGGEPRRVTAGRYHFESLVPSPAVAGAALYALRQRTERPFEVVRIGADTPASGTAVTDVNGAVYAKLALPTVEERWFPATDGQRIHAWVVLPPGFERDRKYPMLLYCQGGPQSQVGQWFSYRWNFHLMAAQGYVVLAVNRRGLPGFGSAWNEQISRDWGGQAMQDLLSATDAMFEEPYVDRERTAAVGASFGGYTVYWLMGNDRENRFRAMIAHCGVFNLESMYLSTEELFFTNQDLGGPFWQDSETLRDYQRFSPHRFAQHWSTPLLVIHGQKDFRVPVEQGLQAFTAAQIRGVPSRFLYFPDEGHWVLSAQNGVLWHRVFFDWLAETMPADESP